MPGVRALAEQFSRLEPDPRSADPLYARKSPLMPVHTAFVQTRARQTDEISERLQVALDLPGRNLLAVLVPLLGLGLDESLEDVIAERLANDLVA